MKLTRLDRTPQIIAATIGGLLLTLANLQASSFFGFETVGAATTTDGQVLADQYRAASAFRLGRADGGSVVIAKTGLPYTAFGAGADTATLTSGDSLLPSDPWASAVGDSFIKLSGSPTAALVITLDYPSSAMSGLILDIDP